MTALLSVRGVGKRFGGLTALADVSFDVEPGELVGLMGANGAGKTTLFSLIAGNARPSSGDIRYDGQSILGTLFLFIVSEVLWIRAPLAYMLILGAVLAGFVLVAPGGILGLIDARRARGATGT